MRRNRGRSAVPRRCNNGTLCGGDGERRSRAVASQTEKARDYTVAAVATHGSFCAVRRLSTKAKINPTVDGVLMAREASQLSVRRPSVILIGGDGGGCGGGAVFEMAFGDTTSETEIRRRRIDHRSHMLPIEQQQGSQPESGGERKGHRTDGQRAGKQTRANKHNFPDAARPADGRTA